MNEKLIVWSCIVLINMVLWAIWLYFKVEHEQQIIKTKRFRLSSLIAYYDFWIGVYYDRKKGCWYIFFWPMNGFIFTWYSKDISKARQRLEKYKNIYGDFSGAEKAIILDALQGQHPVDKAAIDVLVHGTETGRFKSNGLYPNFSNRPKEALNVVVQGMNADKIIVGFRDSYIKCMCTSKCDGCDGYKPIGDWDITKGLKI